MEVNDAPHPSGHAGGMTGLPAEFTSVTAAPPPQDHPSANRRESASTASTTSSSTAPGEAPPPPTPPRTRQPRLHHVLLHRPRLEAMAEQQLHFDGEGGEVRRRRADGAGKRVVQPIAGVVVPRQPRLLLIDGPPGGG